MIKKDVVGFKQRTLLICTCKLTGASFCKGAFDALEKTPIGTLFALAHEPENPFDTNAIRVITTGGQPRGYLPRTHNEIPARLLASGFVLHAALIDVDPTLKKADRHTLGVYMAIA